MTDKKILYAFLAYVENDFEAADPDYVREVLHDICGLTDEELKEIGLGWILT